MNASEQRRAPRRRVGTAITVDNAISDERLGHIGNISSSGLMLISNKPLRADAIYQLRLTLPSRGQGEHTLEFGVHEQWSEAANVPGQYWTGFRIIAISESDALKLRKWIEAPGGEFV
ncbi:PilZ domain-containing protein [Oleiagrimonas citrea]|uniref:PilZ domain-containing protein n=1 Tax=Oleiagrimonas citrea TaxID=1665687 RepID=A0A846ZP93_9GAMM|nr:PilZ domain-containing protein [Oleiagrimonas citrea]NKZ39380.1 PilZ domain-containing protein [Oleiagrimonas citrea]